MAQRVDSSQPHAHRSPTRASSIDPRIDDVVHVRSSPLTARPGRSSYCCGLSESFIRVLGVAQREGRR
jgi:hypothetical protein